MKIGNLCGFICFEGVKRMIYPNEETQQAIEGMRRESESNHCQLEAVDRLNMLRETVRAHLLEHPFIVHTPEILSLVLQAVNCLDDAHELASKMDNIPDRIIYAKVGCNLA